MQATHLCQTELLPIYAGKTDLGKDNVSLSKLKTKQMTKAFIKINLQSSGKGHNQSLLICTAIRRKRFGSVCWCSHFFPGSCAVGLACSIYSSLVLAKVDQSGGQAAKVGHIIVQQLSCLIHLLIIASITNLKDKKEKSGKKGIYSRVQACPCFKKKAAL